MDRDTPESLLQFMDNVTESVRAALERPVEDKEVDHSTLLQRQFFDNQSDAKEQRRHKLHTRRRRHRFPQQPKNSQQTDPWECRSPHQLQVLSHILGISDPNKHGILKDQHLTEWEQNLHHSPNACREYNDDSGEGMLECQGQFNMQPQQGSVTRPGAPQTDLPIYCQTEDQSRGMYSPMTETQFTYTHNNTPRTLDEVLNMMPVGCHLPPPVHPAVSNFTAKRRPKRMDAASRRRKAQIMGIPESGGRYSPPQVTRTVREGSQLPPRSQDQYAEYCPNDGDLLSQLVTELDKTQIFDKLTGESVFSQSPKEMNIEDMRAIGRSYADKSYGELEERINPSEFAYEDQKTSNGSNCDLLEWQSQFNVGTQEGSVSSSGASSQTNLPIYCQTEDQRRGIYSPMTETQFTYMHNNTPRTLDEVLNVMPVGCHLPPPVYPDVSNFTAKRRPKLMDAALRRRKAQIKGIPENGVRYSPPQVSRTPREGSQLPPRSQDQYAEYCPNDGDLLSQLVTELDTTQVFDQLTGESVFSQSPKEMNIEDMRAIGRSYADKSFGELEERIDPSEFAYEDQKTSNGSNWGQCASQAAKQKRFATKQRSFDLSCTGHRFPDSRNLQSNNDVGLNGLKRNSASMETLQFTGRIRVPNNDVSFSKHRKSHLLAAMKERRSMPNLYKHIPQ